MDCLLHGTLRGNAGDSPELEAENICGCCGPMGAIRSGNNVEICYSDTLYHAGCQLFQSPGVA